MSKNVIYYYSGSGNSLSLARQIAANLSNTDMIPIYTLRENPMYHLDTTNSCTVAFMKKFVKLEI